MNTYHKTVGHPSEDTTRLTAKFYNIKLTKDWKICIECALAKRMQRCLAKTNENTAIKSALVTMGAKSVCVQIEVKRLCSLRMSVIKPNKFEK